MTVRYREFDPARWRWQRRIQRWGIYLAAILGMLYAFGKAFAKASVVVPSAHGECWDRSATWRRERETGQVILPVLLAGLVTRASGIDEVGGYRSVCSEGSVANNQGLAGVNNSGRPMVVAATTTNTGSTPVGNLQSRQDAPGSEISRPVGSPLRAARIVTATTFLLVLFLGCLVVFWGLRLAREAEQEAEGRVIVETKYGSETALLDKLLSSVKG